MEESWLFYPTNMKTEDKRIFLSVLSSRKRIKGKRVKSNFFYGFNIVCEDLLQNLNRFLNFNFPLPASRVNSLMDGCLRFTNGVSIWLRRVDGIRYRFLIAARGLHVIRI